MGRIPDLRPSIPLSTGPTLFFAVGPTSWHATHFLYELAPAVRSCATAVPTQAIEITDATNNFLIFISPC